MVGVTDASDLLITDADFALQDAVRKAERARNTRIPVILIGDARDEPKAQAVNGQAMYLPRPLDQAMYGGALTQNPSATAQGWRSFVDTIPVFHGTQRPVPGH